MKVEYGIKGRELDGDTGCTVEVCMSTRVRRSHARISDKKIKLHGH